MSSRLYYYNFDSLIHTEHTMSLMASRCLVNNLRIKTRCTVNIHLRKESNRNLQCRMGEWNRLSKWLHCRKNNFGRKGCNSSQAVLVNWNYTDCKKRPCMTNNLVSKICSQNCSHMNRGLSIACK